jgi:hypothetical protein
MICWQPLISPGTALTRVIGAGLRSSGYSGNADVNARVIRCDHWLDHFGQSFGCGTREMERL